MKGRDFFLRFEMALTKNMCRQKLYMHDHGVGHVELYNSVHFYGYRRSISPVNANSRNGGLDVFDATVQGHPPFLVDFTRKFNGATFYIRIELRKYV